MLDSHWPYLCLLILFAATACGSDILMMTLGSTKSHKMPFWALARGLIRRGHNVTFISPFAPDFHLEGLEEITPEGIVSYVRTFMSIDMVGARMRGEEPLPPNKFMRYPHEICEIFYDDPETKSFLKSERSYDVIVLDGAFPECAMGIVYHFKRPFIFINTVGFITLPLSNSGSPAPFSYTPFFGRAYTDKMGLIDRTLNAAWHILGFALHRFAIGGVQGVLRENFTPRIPYVNDMTRNVNFILQIGYHSVTYPRAYMPNVAEVGCIHCHEPKPLDSELEEWISGAGEAGFVYVSMGSSVRTSSMPLAVHRLFVGALGRLPHRVLWKQDADQNLTDIPPNVRLYKWLPQQDLLGHPKIKAFITHLGVQSLFETVYHGVPIVAIPVFCDQDVHAYKAELDGYAKKLELRYLTSEQLYNAIISVINEPKYKTEVKKQQMLLRDQMETPLDKAVYWTEYVIRHKGAKHLQSPAKDLNLIQYFMIDSILLVLVGSIISFMVALYIYRFFSNMLLNYVENKQMFSEKSNNLLKRSTILIKQATKAKNM